MSSQSPEDFRASRCGECGGEDFDFDRAHSFGLYTHVLRALILQLKFREHEDLARRLGELLAAAWNADPELSAERGAVIVPVPLHRARQRERGYNQAELLARALSRKLGRERGGAGPVVEARCLTRTRPTTPQTGLGRRERRENVLGVFALSEAHPLQGKFVVLVDDVMTTGATLSACAAEIKRGGAERVIALTLARAAAPAGADEEIRAGVPVDELPSDWP